MSEGIEYKATITDPLGRSMDVVIPLENLLAVLALVDKATSTKAKQPEPAARATRGPKKADDAAPAGTGKRGGRKSAVSDTVVKMVEDMLIEGKMKPGAIAKEAELKSPALVYVIKSRLKKEGRIS